MRFLFILLLNLAVGYVGQLFLPWWIIPIVAALISLALAKKPLPAFLAAFLAYFLMWAAYSWYISSGNDHLLADKIGGLFGNISAMSLFLFSGLVAGIFGGLGSLLGWSASRVFTPAPDN